MATWDIDLPPPDGFLLETDGSERRLSWRWFSARAVFAAFFAVLWNGFLIFQLRVASWFGTGLSSASRGELAVLFVMAAFGTLFAYLAAAYLLNRTTIRIDPARVSVRHGPVPWFGNKDVPRREIRWVSTEKRDLTDETLFQPQVTHRIRLGLASGAAMTLITGLRESDEAIFIKQQVQRP